MYNVVGRKLKLLSTGEIVTIVSVQPCTYTIRYPNGDIGNAYHKPIGRNKVDCELIPHEHAVKKKKK